MHRRGERIVGGLAHVDIVVGVRQLRAGQLVGTVGDHLIGVHVGLRARTGLPDDEREMPVQFAGDHFVAGPGDGRSLFVGHLFGLELMVGKRGRFFQDAKGMNNLGGHGFNPNADFKILMAALGLRAPKPVGGHLHFAHRVMFNAIFHLSRLLQLRIRGCG